MKVQLIVLDLFLKGVFMLLVLAFYHTEKPAQSANCPKVQVRISSETQTVSLRLSTWYKTYLPHALTPLPYAHLYHY
jgi:hypothetical protein